MVESPTPNGGLLSNVSLLITLLVALTGWALSLIQYIASKTERKERVRLIAAQADSEVVHGKQIALEMALHLAEGVRADHERLRNENERQRERIEELEDEREALEPRLEKLAQFESLEELKPQRYLLDDDPK